MNIENYVVTPLQMKNIETASESYSVSLTSLMDNAGAALAAHIIKVATNNNIVLLCGNGNNGGDGFIAAAILKKKGYNTKVILTMGDPKTKLAKAAFQRIKLKNISYLDKISKDETFSNVSVIVDCIMGTGFNGTLKDEIKELNRYINKLSCIKIACDIPTGISGLNGFADKDVIKYDYTVAMGAIKLGSLIYPGKKYCGKVIICDIGIPESVYSKALNKVYFIDDEFVKENLPVRNDDSHKGDYGRLTVIAGSRNFPGAAALCCMSAQMCGVGLCQLASTDYVCQTVASKYNEITYLPLMESQQGQISPLNKDFLVDNLKKSDCVVIGCGLSYSQEIASLVIALVQNLTCPVVIDADAITSISTSLLTLKNRTAPTILTPHIGELATLSKLTHEQVLESRVQLAMMAQRELNATIVSKGTSTIICSEDSRTMYVSPGGNSGLAKGGSGDVLAGMIGSFIAQGIDHNIASAIAVYLHNKAAQRLSEKISKHGMLPSDILKEVSLLLNDFEN